MTMAPRRGWFPFADTSLSGLPTPFWILMGYLFVGTTCIDEEWAAVGRLRPRLLLGALALVTLFASFTERRVRGDRPAHRFVQGWLVAFVVAGALSAVFAFDTKLASDAQIAHTTTMLGFFLLLAIVRTRREVCVTILVLVAGFAFYVLRSATEYLNGRHQFTMGVSRMMGAGTSLSDPNSFGGTLAFSLPLVLWAGIHTRSLLLRTCVLAYGLLAAWCAIATHSRSGFLLLALNTGWAFVVIPGRRFRLVMAALLVAFGAYLVGFQSKNAMDRYASIFSKDTYKNESSTRGRIEGYQIAARMLAEEPVLGVGPGCWSAYRMRKIDGHKLMPHNMPGQLAATMGVLGAGTFLGYLVAVLSFGLAARAARARSPDPWDRAVRALAGTALFTVLLLLVSGTAAHNIERQAWYLMPALLACAVRAGAEAPTPRNALR
jgi:putative inorganic carbon (HCO3(-)) transporter